MKLQLKNKVSLFIWLCSVAFLFLPIYVFGQIPSHLELADSLFKQGVYASAKLNYELAMQLEDSKVDEKLGNAKLCSEYLTSGDDAFYKDRFEEAKSYFEKILRINPFDPNMADKIEACDKKAYAPSSEKQTDTIDLLYRDGYKIYQKGHYSPLSDRELRNIFAGTQSYIYYNRAMAKQTATTVLYPLGATAGVVASCFLVFTFGGLSMVPV
jgi:tetratricopeptide (TPR) repeat protein